MNPLCNGDVTIFSAPYKYTVSVQMGNGTYQDFELTCEILKMKIVKDTGEKQTQTLSDLPRLNKFVVPRWQDDA